VIRARLDGVRVLVQGLVIPPLGQDDPHISLLLLYLYDQLRCEETRIGPLRTDSAAQ